MITDRHVLFARAIVALAREHGMTNLDMSYRRSHVFPRDESGPEHFQTVRMAWNEGRHGDTAQITLQTESSVRVPERVASST